MTVNGSSLSRFPSKDENVTESGPPAIESMLQENHSTKGQLVSECPFDVLNFPLNQQKDWTNFCPRI